MPVSIDIYGGCVPVPVRPRYTTGRAETRASSPRVEARRDGILVAQRGPPAVLAVVRVERHPAGGARVLGHPRAAAAPPAQRLKADGHRGRRAVMMLSAVSVCTFKQGKQWGKRQTRETD